MSKKRLGSKIWVFPDGELPPLQPANTKLRNKETHGHESLVILNPGKQDASVKFTIYFNDRTPIVVKPLFVPRERVVCFRTDEPLGKQKIRIPEGKQYSLMVESSQPVVAQIGRMDIRQSNLAYYTVMGFPAE